MTVDGRQAVAASSANFRAIASPSPARNSIFCRAVSPDRKVIDDFGMASALARNAISALLAAPSTGGAARRGRGPDALRHLRSPRRLHRAGRAG
jgi:hypothetical protein